LFVTSKAHVGSSANNSLVFQTKARAIATLWLSHQLRLKTGVLIFDSNQTIFKISFVEKFLSSQFSSITKSTFSSTVKLSISLKF
jgi:hypothetical protein